MHCTNCGVQVQLGVRFCPNCGRPIADPEITQVAGAQSGVPRRDEAEGVERVVFTTHPTLFFVRVGYSAAALSAILLTIVLAYAGLSASISLLVALLLLLPPTFYHIRRNTILYKLTDSRIEIDRGIVVRTTHNIPLHSVQDVTVSATLLQRLLGIGDLVIENASERGGTTVLRNIRDPRHHAELILRQLRRWR